MFIVFLIMLRVVSAALINKLRGNETTTVWKKSLMESKIICSPKLFSVVPNSLGFLGRE